MSGDAPRVLSIDDINLIVFDCEVFKHDWLFVFRPLGGENVHFWNDPDGLAEYMEANDLPTTVFAGFNNKRYDAQILKSVLNDCTPEEVKEVNDFIIGGNLGWEHDYLQGFWYQFNQTDLMDDTMLGTSLKSIEGHLYMNILESSVPFDIDRKLTDEERDEVLKYCEYDVEATVEFIETRRDYLDTKIHLANLADLDPVWALSQTDPMLAAAFLGAEKSAAPTDDEREYVFPDRLDYDLIPDDVIAFFETIHDMSIPDEELFKTKFETEIGGCPVTFAWGGVHGALSCVELASDDEIIVLNDDVSSLYPSLMIEYGYVSRAVPDPRIFADIRAERFKAKREGDKKTANALKSPMNKAYGAMLNPYNPLYDPLMARSVCISGQLSMCMLAVALTRVDGLQIIQINTDGIAFSVPHDKRDKVKEILDWWQEKTHLELEEDEIARIVQKDVSNYALIKDDGSEKVKGSYLVRGISPIGAWSINNSARIVAEAIKKNLLYGTPVEEVILACDDPKEFQIIAKASHKYSKVYQEVWAEDGMDEMLRKIDCQHCNRVFATKDERLGRLYKIKRGTEQVAKIENLPEHCLIANDGMPSIEDIDKDYYIELAARRAMEFTKKKGGEKLPAKKTETVDYSQLNVYQKLALARHMFLTKDVKKSGYNDHLDFEYFELEDIVPVQDEIFGLVGLIEIFTYVEPSKTVSEDGIVNETSALARSRVVNIDKPDEFIDFCNKWTEVAPIKSSSGKKVVNEAQTNGSVQTYLRRYNKAQILDIVETDTSDAAIGEEFPDTKKVTEESTEEKPRAATKKPATKTKSARSASSTQRKEIAKSLTNGKTDALMVKQLRGAIAKLKKECGDDPEVKKWIADVGTETDRLTNVTKGRAKELLDEAGEMREAHQSKGEEDE